MNVKKNNVTQVSKIQISYHFFCQDNKKKKHTVCAFLTSHFSKLSEIELLRSQNN